MKKGKIKYESLRKRWQKILLDEITNISGNTKEVKLIKNKLYKKRLKDFMFILRRR